MQEIDEAASIVGVTGIELVSTWDITESTVGEVKNFPADNNLKLSSIFPDHFSQKPWALGAFTSRDSVIRREAIAHTKTMMYAAHQLGSDLVNLRPGQDGFDYPFQGDFLQQRDSHLRGGTNWVSTAEGQSLRFLPGRPGRRIGSHLSTRHYS